MKVDRSKKMSFSNHSNGCIIFTCIQNIGSGSGTSILCSKWLCYALMFFFILPYVHYKGYTRTWNTPGWSNSHRWWTFPYWKSVLYVSITTLRSIWGSDGDWRQAISCQSAATCSCWTWLVTHHWSTSGKFAPAPPNLSMIFILYWTHLDVCILSTLLPYCLLHYCIIHDPRPTHADQKISFLEPRF